MNSFLRPSLMDTAVLCLCVLVGFDAVLVQMPFISSLNRESIHYRMWGIRLSLQAPLTLHQADWSWYLKCTFLSLHRHSKTDRPAVSLIADKETVSAPESLGIDVRWLHLTPKRRHTLTYTHKIITEAALRTHTHSHAEDKRHEYDYGWQACMDHLRFCSGSVSRLERSWGGSRAFERAFSSPSEINVFSSGNRLSAGILETHPVRYTLQLSSPQYWLRLWWKQNTLPDEGRSVISQSIGSVPSLYAVS